MSPKVVPARGMRDIPPASFRRRQRVLDLIRGAYEDHGFAQIETPAVEPIERMRSGQGGDNESMLYEIQRRGLDPEAPVLPRDAVDSALRYDLTVPLTRFYASNRAELPEVFRAFQTGPVWRAERPQKGRYRQFVQCDIDIIGEPGILAEVELVTATLDALGRLGLLDGASVRVNDRRILTDLLGRAGVPAELQARTLITVDKLDKIGMDGVRSELAEAVGLEPGVVDALTGTLESIGTETPLAEMAGGKAEQAGISLYDLGVVAQAVTEAFPQARLVFDPTLVRGMGYYTGPIFEVSHAGSGSSVAGGGRYDGVVGKWLGRDVPACGFSIGFERIVDLVELPEDESPRVALLCPAGADPLEVARAKRDVTRALRDKALAGGVEARKAAVAIPVTLPRKPSGAFFARLGEAGYTHSIRLGQGLEELKAL
ncbi:histidine--tRNA ligase [Falsarthrobacter nasiphocae]|uniref:Histidyl-tRNA synthetase n=1 Tax=Falsarthrobacter nasiphocae TaxID=189863 RepID=A0AAE3YF13_9MICC|nr:ATP phosphoribosyltransferase regulatory subunit [Falsarthrobacter nasiphocae]MDR6892199.1 histidyl-tRNA synthetase [Falsarthrobacter nasiphocae]